MHSPSPQNRKSYSLRRFPYTGFLRLFWILLTGCVLLLSCGNLQELIGLKEKEEPIPADVSETAKGMMELFQGVFEAPDPANADKPGMNVEWEQPNVKLVIQFQSYAADPTAPTITITGTYTITVTSTNPYTITIAGSVSVANYTYKTVEMNGTFQFPGTSPQSGDPTVSGSFKVDGKSYDLKKVYESIDWDDDGGGSITQTYPNFFIPAPPEIRGKYFYLCGSRPFDTTECDTVTHRGDYIGFDPSGQECKLMGKWEGIYAWVNFEEYPGKYCVYIYRTSDFNCLGSFNLQCSPDYLYIAGNFYGETLPTYYFLHITPDYSGPFPTENF